MLSDKGKMNLAQNMNSNSYEIYVISIEEMDAIIKSSPNGKNKDVQSAWKKIKKKVGVGASYYASVDDVVTMAKLIGDLGGIGARVYIKSYGGKPHIILKGKAGLRTILTGTKYGIKNPKVVSMGLGKSGAIAAAKQGGILTIVLLSVYRVVDYFLTDEATLNQLIGTLATDVVKVGIATGASILAATAFGALTLAVGPIVAVIAVGVGVSLLLEYADNQLNITNRVIAGLDELEENTQSYIAQKKNQVLDATEKAVDQVIDYTLESVYSISVDWVKKTLREYLSASPRVK